MIELEIQTKTLKYFPVVEGTIQWVTERKGQPAKLTFSVVKDEIINFQEGDMVNFVVDGYNVFKGFVFTKNRDKNGIIKVTAYDQLRYLKNKFTYAYENKTASEVIQTLCKYFGINTGQIEETPWVIARKIEQDKSLIDMMLNALDLTLQNSKKLYILFDQFGELTLRDAEAMKCDLLIDQQRAENFQYQSSIDNETYNLVVLRNKDNGKKIIASDNDNIEKWGLLQYFDQFDTDDVNVQSKADALLKLYNQKRRSLKISKAFGDPRVRAGYHVPIDVHLGDIVAKNYMLVERATHSFSQDGHTMDLTLSGGGIHA